MARFFCTAQLVAVAVATLALAGCDAADMFDKFDLPEGPEVATAPWPRLVDVPSAPPVGTYTEAVPDPAVGAQVIENLSVEAAVAKARAEPLNEPVIAPERRAAMDARAEAGG